MEPHTAEEVATEIYDAIHDNVATKTDLAIAVRDLKIWTVSLFALVVAILSGVMTVFHFLGGSAGSGPTP